MDLLRGNSSQRGYDADWKKIRLVALRRDNYLCRLCFAKGIPTQAKDVDHIVPISVDLSKRLDLDNLQSLCGPCHLSKTYEEDGSFGKEKKLHTVQKQ